MSSPQARSRHRERRTVMVEKFCARFDMSLNPLNNGYQLRIENVLDVYPTNGRYCILQSGERGDWETPADLKKLMLKALPSVKVYEVDKGEQPIHGVHITGVNVIKEYDVTTEPITTFKPRWYQGKLWHYLNRHMPKTMIRLRWRGRNHL